MYQSQTGKKNLDHQGDSCYCGGQKQDCSYNSPIIGINANVIKIKRKDIPQIKCFNCKKEALLQQVSSKHKKRVKKLVIILVISMPITATREKVIQTAKTVEIIETARTDKDGKKSKCGEYQENLAQVLCIR